VAVTVAVAVAVAVSMAIAAVCSAALLRLAQQRSRGAVCARHARLSAYVARSVRLLLIHVEKCMLLQTCPAHCFFFSALNTGPPKQSSTTIASTSATPARLVWVDTKATSYNIRRRGGGQAARDFSGEVESSLLFTIETLAFDSLFPLLIFCGWPAAFNVCFCASVIACLRSLLSNMNF